jgi:hypothetical protein
MIRVSDEAAARLREYLGPEGPWGVRVVASPG